MSKLESFWRLSLLFIMGVLIAFVALAGLAFAAHTLLWLLRGHVGWLPLAVLAALVVLTYLREA